MKNSIKSFFYFCFLLICFCSLFIVSVPTVAEEAVYSLITEAGTSAESMAIADIQGFSQNASLVFENPATLSQTGSLALSHFAVEYLRGETSYKNYALAFRTDIGTFGFGYMAMNLNDLYETGVDEFGDFYIVDSFSFRDSLSTVSYQNRLNKHIDFGLSLVRLEKVIGDIEADSMNVDMGLFVKGETLSLSSVVKNALFFQKVQYSNGGAELAPTQLIQSVELKPLPQWSVFAQMKFHFHEQLTLQSYAIQFRPVPVLALSVGHKEFLEGTTASGAGVNQSITFGSSLDLFGLSLSYAWEKSAYFNQDNQQYISMNWVIDPLVNRSRGNASRVSDSNSRIGEAVPQELSTQKPLAQESSTQESKN